MSRDRWRSELRIRDQHPEHRVRDAPLEAAQIRWLLPRLGTWAGFGGLLAGTAIPILLRNLHVPPQTLMWASGIPWLIAGWLVRSDYASRAPAKRRQSSNGQQGHLQQLFTIPLVRWMTIGSAGITWTGLLLQYESRVALQATSWEPQKITLVMCVLLAVSNVGGIATQALVTTPVLEHFGVGLALAILPAALWGWWALTRPGARSLFRSEMAAGRSP